MIYSKRLSKIANIRHGISTKNTLPTELEKIRTHAVMAKQVHKDGILWIRERPPIFQEADAIGTSTVALSIAISTADCTPIFLVACNENGIAKSLMCVHAGWRSTALQISAKALLKLVQESKPAFVIAVIGPCISAKSFEVGEDVVTAFPNSEKMGLSQFIGIKEGKKKYLFDLPAANRLQLEHTAENLGVNLEIEHIDICTFLSKDLHSFRRDKENAGRMLSFIELI